MPQAKVISEVFGDVVPLGEQNATVRHDADHRFVKIHVIPVSPTEARFRVAAEAAYRVFEIVFASVGLIVALPLMLATAIVIRLDSPGPVLFFHIRPARSVRVRGRDLEGRTDLIPPPGGYDRDALYYAPSYFKLIKFRTMYRDAQARFPECYYSAYARENFRSTFAHTQNDPRVTRVGRVLRKLSVDELPNLWSVVVGDMRLVGPRPEATEVLQYYTPEEMIKFTIKPGITGLAQVSGRKLLNWGDTLALDLEYVRTRSVALDMKIILLTIKRVMTMHGAL
jgi:lipopolysaccharide/colanic/teichoic acid biosynthesis glycosyltransferase